MHLAHVHSPMTSIPSTPTTTLYFSVASNKNVIIAFLLGTLLGTLIAMSFFSVSPHQFHTDMASLSQHEITAKLMALPQAQKRKVLQDVFGANYHAKQLQKSGASSSSSIDSPSSLNKSNQNQATDAVEKHHEQFFPFFEPVPKKPEKILSIVTQSLWAAIDIRAVEKDFGKSASENMMSKINQTNSSPPPPPFSSASSSSSNKKFLSWTWINVRPHINALPALTKQEVKTIWTSVDFLKRVATQRATKILFSSSIVSADSSSAAASKYLFPVWLQTKYGYRGDSIAVVGGLFEPLTDRSLRETAIRELREELGVVCSKVVSHGRFVNDANRGCGTFESFYAKNCTRTAQSVGDKEAKDSEAQQLLIFTREDLIELLANTRELSRVTEFPYASEKDAYDFKSNTNKNNNNKLKNKNASSTKIIVPPSLAIKKKFFEDFGKEREELESQAGSGHSLSHGLVLKETKWISTISMTLLALEQEKH